MSGGRPVKEMVSSIQYTPWTSIEIAVFTCQIAGMGASRSSMRMASISTSLEVEL